MSKKRGIIWFRQDLRYHDNEALKEALENFDEIIPVFVFDERIFEGWQNALFPKVFRTRLKFILESVLDLREELRFRGAELYVRKGRTEEIIFDLARQYGVGGVYCSRERMPVGVWLQDNLEVKLWSLGLELHYFQGKMLFHTSDLPFPIARMPDLFSSFRKETVQFVPVRDLLDMPRTNLRIPDIDLEAGEIPTLEDFGYHTDPKIAFSGGEKMGLAKLQETIAKTAGGYEGDLKVSPWLAQGSLSPRKIYHEISQLPFSLDKLKKQWTNKLMLRDYYRLKSSRNPAALFRPGGWVNKKVKNQNWNEEDLVVWIRGETGVDFIDACMKCLFHTGFLNHAKRKAVARYLIEDMGLDWQSGAGYFESVLLDYDPCSNYGNWQRQAGLSLDLKGAYYYSLENTIEQEDPEGVFTERWKNEKVDFDFSNQKVVV